ncbi:MAG: polyprenyl synthetase family protein [Pseudomonadota bacterium]|nr:polyprenyl synthetase family protein [Pseudomonadota bacterium]
MWKQDRAHFYSHLQRYCRSHYDSDNKLDQALNYALLNSAAKYLRPLLTITAARAFDSKNSPLPAALAVEFIHTFSLIHDDLPCMDDDDLRRGRKSLHVQFDEATALLAGDALLSDAFHLLALELAATDAQTCVRLLAAAVGSKGMIQGQALELKHTKPTIAPPTEFIYRLKTGKLMGVACALGAVVAAQQPAVVEHMLALGEDIGLSYQVKDDIADGDGDNDYRPCLVSRAAAIKTKLIDLKLQHTDFARLCADIVSPTIVMC